MINDELGGNMIVITTDPDKTSASAYLRIVDGEILEFTLTDEGLIDSQTGSIWDWFGACLKGKMKGKQLIRATNSKSGRGSPSTLRPVSTTSDPSLRREGMPRFF